MQIYTPYERGSVHEQIFKSYIAIIKNSVGTKQYKNFYAVINGKSQDVLKNGRLSCAFYVSNILFGLGLIKRPHMEVGATEKELIASGWEKVTKPKIGTVLVYGLINNKEGKVHPHIGFYIGNNKAICNSAKTGTPKIQHWIFGMKNGKPVHPIVAMYDKDFSQRFI